MLLDTILASLFDPIIILVSAVIGGLLTRTWWQAVLVALILVTGFFGFLGVEYKLDVVPIAEGIAAAIEAVAFYGLKCKLAERKARKAAAKSPSVVTTSN